MLIVLAFKGLLTQLWCFIYGSEDLKQNIRNPWLVALLLGLSCCALSTLQRGIQKRNLFLLYHFLFSCFLGTSSVFADLERKRS